MPAVCALLCAHPAQSQTPLPVQQRSDAFDRLDRTSRNLIGTVTCALSSARARARGAFGPSDSLGNVGMCIERKGRRFGLFVASDSAFTKAQRVSIVDLAISMRDTVPIDTVAVLAQARAAQAGALKGSTPFERAERQYAPFSMRSDGDSIEVWLLPTGLLLGQAPTTLGGELGFVYSPDGRTLAREINAFDRFRSIVVPGAGPVELLSQEEDLPLFSELVAFNILHDRGRDVSLVTKRYRSQLVGQEPNSVWVHTPRK